MKNIDRIKLIVEEMDHSERLLSHEYYYLSLLIQGYEQLIFMRSKDQGIGKEEQNFAEAWDKYQKIMDKLEADE